MATIVTAAAADPLPLPMPAASPVDLNATADLMPRHNRYRSAGPERTREELLLQLAEFNQLAAHWIRRRFNRYSQLQAAEVIAVLNP